MSVNGLLCHFPFPFLLKLFQLFELYLTYEKIILENGRKSRKKGGRETNHLRGDHP